MLFQNARLQRVINEIKKTGKIYAWGENISKEEILDRWKRFQPIPYVDQDGLRCLYLREEGVSVLDKKLTEFDKDWINTDLPLIQIAAINAAAEEKGFICINQLGQILNTDYRVRINKNIIRLLSSLCGEDCIIKNEKNLTVLVWDE